jgi:hypothetical protein
LKLAEQQARDLEDHAVGDHAGVECAAGLPRLEVPIADANRHRARGEPIPAKISGGAGDQREKLALERRVIGDVGRKGLVAADALRFARRLDGRPIDAAYAIVQPLRLARAEPLRERGNVVLEHVGYDAHAERGEAFLKTWSDERNFRQCHFTHEGSFAAGIDDVYARRAASRFRLRALDRHLGNELVGSTANRNRKVGLLPYSVANSMSRPGKWFMMVDAFGAAHVEIPLIDARAFNDGRKSLENSPDLMALHRACFARHRNAHRVGTKAKRASNRHR